MGLDGMGYLQTGPFVDHLAVIKIGLHKSGTGGDSSFNEIVSQISVFFLIDGFPKELFRLVLTSKTC